MCRYNYFLPQTKSIFSPDLNQIRTTYNGNNFLEQKAWKKNFFFTTGRKILMFFIIAENRETCCIL